MQLSALTRDFRWRVDLEWQPRDWSEVTCADEPAPRPSHAVFAHVGDATRPRLLLCGETAGKETTWRLRPARSTSSPTRCTRAARLRTHC